MDRIDNFIDFLNRSVSPFHVIENSIQLLEQEGFTSLNFEQEWNLKKGGAYYVKLYDTSLYAFKVGKEVGKDGILRMAAAHTDFPAFRIKPNPVMKESGYVKLNTEVYGGVILSTWFDRPLSIAGKVALRSEKLFQRNEVLVDFEEPLLVIPNLAIHFNREVNNGVPINKQTDVLPLLGIAEEEGAVFFTQILADRLNVPVEDILDYDLFIYNLDQVKKIGLNKEFICGPRIDDLSSVHGLIQGIITDVDDKDIHMIGLFDNEEIGNHTKQGCDTAFTAVLLEKIYGALGRDRINLYESMMNSILISADVAHAFHPNYPSQYDPTNRAMINKGIVFKINTSQKYAFDTGAIAMIQQLCDEHEIAYQKFTNRSDAVGGSTMGPSLSTLLPMRTVDIGIPLLAMHSACETMGVKDQESFSDLMITFFGSKR